MRTVTVLLACLLAAALVFWLSQGEERVASPVPVETPSLADRVAPREAELADPGEPAPVEGPGAVIDVPERVEVSRERVFEEKYEGMGLAELEDAFREMGRRKMKISEPIIERRLEVGQYRSVGPLPRDASHRWSSSDYPAGRIPIVSTTHRNIEGTDTKLVLIVEVYPEDDPELLAVHEEQEWLKARLAELRMAAREDR